MPEYVTFEIETTDDPDVRLLYINQRLTDAAEVYATAQEGAVGSPIAQLICLDVGGVAALTIWSSRASQMSIGRSSSTKFVTPSATFIYSG